MMAQSDPPTLCEGRYQLREILGEGGMAVVYKAFDTHLRVERAIKRLVPAAARIPEARARLETEARAMASLAHPNVVAVFDIRRDGDDIFLVMELITGGTLWEWVRSHGPMPPRMAASTLLPVLEAVAVAHRAEIIHRDLKPHNILIDAEGKPRVADFGIAHVRARTAEGSYTRTGSILGTWAFMAPEQRHSARGVDERSDIYALGATLFALLTAEAPFDLFAADQDARLLAGIPKALAELIKRATRYDPADRYQTVSEMVAAIEAAMPGLEALPQDTPNLTQRPLPSREPGFATAGLATQSELDESQSLNTDSPAAKVLFRRRRLFSELEMDGLDAPPPRPSTRWSLLGAMAPALVALLAGGLVLLAAHRNQSRGLALFLTRLGFSSIHAHGEAEQVFLRDGTGEPREPGLLSPGTYEVEARFPGVEAFTPAGTVQLEEGQLLELHCEAADRRCRTRQATDG